MREEDDTPEEIRETMLTQIGQSLENLQMDFVDILYLHSVESREEIENKIIHDTMQEIKDSGKARYIGVSTHRNMHEVINAVADTGYYDVVLTVVNFTLGDYTELFDAIERAYNRGVGIIAMKTQAVSHRHSKLEIGDRFKSTTVATAALKWILRNKNITAAIPGFTTFEHMEEDFPVVTSLEYTEEEEKLFQECDVKYVMGFCRQCDLCVETCAQKVDIPSLMRVHMYSTRYSNFHRARTTLDSIPEERGLVSCNSCESCTAICPHHVNIPGSINELKLIYV
jgi:predicted aldo/keto reductase-like oxidoreductase